MANIEEEPVKILVARYAAAAADHGRATENGDHKRANKAYKVIESVFRELRRRGPEALRQLGSLLDSPDAGVQCWAGAHALEFAPEDAERALSAVASGNSRLIGLSAEMTLKQWRAGKLHFP